MAVFVAHLPGRWPQFDFGTLPFGAAGVSFFYVLSGFILTYVYGSQLNQPSAVANGLDSNRNNDEARPFDFKKFYLRRFARIWPLHFVTLLISLFLVIGINTYFNKPAPVGKLLVNGMLLQSWIPNYQWIYSLNGPAWSLSVEAFFYLIFPLLLLGGAKQFRRKFFLIAVGTIAGLFAIHQFVPTHEDAWVKLNSLVHTNPLIRLFEFATGVGCGFYFLNRQNAQVAIRDWKRDTAIELASIGTLIAFFGTAGSLNLYAEDSKYGIPLAFWYWFRFSGAAPFFALIVVTLSTTNGLIAKLFSCRFMVYLGEISYSFYMIHLGVMLVLARQQWVNGWWVILGVATTSLVFSVFLASMLYQLVELPCRKWIVGVFEGKGLGFLFTTMATSAVNWIRTPWFVPLIALTVAGGWFVVNYKFDIRSQRHINSIIAATSSDIQNVQFEDDATLLGARTTSVYDGGLVIELVWKLNQGRRSIRVMKLLNADQKVIGRGHANQELFDSVGNDVVIDRVRFGPEQLKGVKSITIGFYDPKRFAAVVDRGPRGPRNRQLFVWESK